jgi:hypothetical protein
MKQQILTQDETIAEITENQANAELEIEKFKLSLKLKMPEIH